MGCICMRQGHITSFGESACAVGPLTNSHKDNKAIKNTSVSGVQIVNPNDAALYAFQITPHA